MGDVQSSWDVAGVYSRMSLELVDLERWTERQRVEFGESLERMECELSHYISKVLL